MNFKDSDAQINFTWWRSIETKHETIVGFDRFYPDEDPARVMIGEFMQYTALRHDCTHAVLINKDTGERWEYTRPDDKSA